MKTMLRCGLGLSLLLVATPPAVHAQDAAKPEAKPIPMKQVPTPGRFEMEVSSGEHKRTYSHPSKAISEIARAVGRAKRAKEGEAPAFEAAITLNDQQFTFSDPAAALEVCKALTAAMRDLPKLRMGLGDLGEIPEVKPEEAQAAAANQQAAAKTKAAAMMEVRRRIQMALRKQMMGGGRSRRPRMPNPLTMQRTIAQEIQKAQQEGLLPSGAAAGGFGGGDPIEAKKEAIVQNLAFVLGQADSTGRAEEKPKDGKPAGEKPAEDAVPKAEN